MGSRNVPTPLSFELSTSLGFGPKKHFDPYGLVLDSWGLQTGVPYMIESFGRRPWLSCTEDSGQSHEQISSGVKV